MDYLVTQSRIKEMQQEIEQLKSLYVFPGMSLLYLDRFFDDLRAQVGLAFYLKSHYVINRNFLIKMQSTCTQMNEKILSFEKECLNFNDWSKIANQNKKESENNLKKIQILLDYADFNDLEVINELIYAEKLKAEKHLFCNKTMAFFPSNLFDSETDYIGNLVFITNAFIGRMGIDFLKKSVKTKFIIIIIIMVKH